MQTSIFRALGRKVTCVGASLAMAASMTAFTPSLIQQASAEGLATDTDKYVTCLSYRAAEPAPEILGLNNVGTNTAWSGLGELNWSAPYYYIFGTDFNSNPNPWMVNTVENYANDTTENSPSMVYYTRQGGPFASMRTYNYSSESQTAWNTLPDVILGNRSNVNYNSEDYAQAAAAANNDPDYMTYGSLTDDGSRDYGVIYNADNIYTMIDTMWDLSDAAQAAAEATGKELRYGDTDVIVANFEQYVKGIQGYVLEQLAANNAEKKKVALIANYDAEAKTYQLISTGEAEGTAAGNRYLEAVQFVANNIADSMEKTEGSTYVTATETDIAACDLVMIGSQTGSENLTSTEDIIASLPNDVQKKTFWASSDNGSAGSCYGVVMNSVENAQNTGRIVGCLYPEYVDQSDLIAYYYQYFYHLNTGTLAEVIANAMDGVRNWNADGSDQSNAVLWSEEDVDDYDSAAVAAILDEGMDYIATASDLGTSSIGTKASDYLPATEEYTAAKTDISTATVGTINSQAYTGKAIEPSVTVTLNGTTLAEDTDYVVEYANNTEVGTATATIYGIGSYRGTTSVTFEIVSSAPTDGFYTDADGNTVFYKNGEQVKGEFVKVDKTTGKAAADDAAAGTYDVYYFRKSGTMITGLAKVYGIWRYFDDDGVRQYGFQDVLWENVVNDDKNADGTYVHADGKTHRMFFYNAGEKPSGTLQAGSYIKIDKETKEILTQAEGDALSDDSTYDVYYPRKNGEILTGLGKVYGIWRYFDENGVRQYGFQDVLWENVINDDKNADGTYVHADGKVHRMFFYNAGEKPSGTLQAGSYIKIDKETKKILTKAEGDALSDDSTYDVYYPRKNGEILTGMGKVYGIWRYFGDDGIRRYGLQNVTWSADNVVNDVNGDYTDGQVHTMYFGAEGPKPSGVLATSTTVEVDGKNYTFDEIGGLTSVDGVPTMVVDL